METNNIFSATYGGMLYSLDDIGEKEMSCKYIKECPSATGWCTGEEQKFEECIPFLIISKENWEKEAKEQTAAAGELRIKLAEHLEEIRNNISELRQQAKTETSDMSIALIQWKIAQLQKEECWIEGLLFGKAQKPAFYADNDTAQPGLMPAM